MKFWKDVVQDKKHPKNNLKSDRVADTIIDVYKKEILDTRIIVSNLIKGSRINSINDSRTIDKDSGVVF